MCHMYLVWRTQLRHRRYLFDTLTRGCNGVFGYSLVHIFGSGSAGFASRWPILPRSRFSDMINGTYIGASSSEFLNLINSSAVSLVIAVSRWFSESSLLCLSSLDSSFYLQIWESLNPTGKNDFGFIRKDCDREMSESLSARLGFVLDVISIYLLSFKFLKSSAI